MIILLYGDDTYRSTQKLNAIKEKFITEVDPQKLNLSVVDGEKLTLAQFHEYVSAAAFLAPKRMVIFKNLVSTNKHKDIAEALTELLTHDSDDSRILVFWESGKPKGKNKNWDLLKKSKFSQEFPTLKPQELNAWIAAEVQKRGSAIEPQAAAYLAANVGADVWQLSHELDKLSSYCGKSITLDAAKELVRAGLDDNIFNFTDALSANNKARALTLLSDQLESGANELYLLTMLTRQFRILLQIKSVLTQNPQATKDSIATELGLHPFVVQKSLGAARNYSLEQLTDIYASLMDIDYTLKSTATDPELLFDLFIARI